MSHRSPPHPHSSRPSAHAWATAGTLAALLVVSAPGCSNNVAPQACRDLVTAVGDKAVECGFDRAANEAAFEDTVSRSQGCDAVESVRDIASFYDDCIPFFEGLTCAQFDDPGLTLPSSCAMQLRTP